MFSNKRDKYWQGVLQQERSYWQGVVTELTNQIVLLKVEPQMAAIQAVPMSEATAPAYISSSDDEALAEYERDRARITADTKAFIEQHAVVEADAA